MARVQTRGGTAAVVLAGGRSRRFGRDKAWARLEGRTFLERVVEAVSAVCGEIIVVRAKGQRLPVTGAQEVEDEVEGRGPLGGMVTGFRALTAERGLVVPVDAPLLVPGLLCLLLGRAGAGVDAVLPQALGFQQPLVAVYRRTACLPAFAAALAGGEGRVLAALEGLRVLEVGEEELRAADPGLLSFHNANTPEALAELEAAARAGRAAKRGDGL